MAEVTITNVFKQPTKPLSAESLPHYLPPCIYAGDFNSHSTTYSYKNNNRDKDTHKDWALATDLIFLHDPKQPKQRSSYRSTHWGMSTNPDLTFINFRSCPAIRRVLNCSQSPSIVYHLLSNQHLLTPHQYCGSSDETPGKLTGRSSPIY